MEATLMLANTTGTATFVVQTTAPEDASVRVAVFNELANAEVVLTIENARRLLRFLGGVLPP